MFTKFFIFIFCNLKISEIFFFFKLLLFVKEIERQIEQKNRVKEREKEKIFEY